MFAFTAILCGHAFGDVIASWNGDLANGSTSGDYTMSVRSADANNAQFENGIAKTIATSSVASQGIIISCPAEYGTQNTTVFFRYSGYEAENGNHSFFSANWEADNKDVVIYGNGAKTRMGIAYGTTSSAVGNQDTNSSDITIPTAGIMMVSMSIQSGDALGTQVAIAPKKEDGTYGEFVQLYRRDNVCWTGKKVTVMRLGGTIASTSHYYRPSLMIDAVEIHNTGTTITEANQLTLFASPEVEVFDGSAPNATQIARFKDASWKGTVWLKNQNINNIDFDNYANENSKIKLTGVTGFPKKASTTYKVKELILENNGSTKAYTVNNGYSGSWSKFKKISGSGTLASTHDATQAWITPNLCTFKGKIDSVGKGLVFVVSDTAAIPEEVKGGGVYIAEGKTATIAAGQEWGIGGAGFVIDGTLKFTEDSSSTNTQVTRWNTGNVSGSGLIDLSDAKGISGNNLRICFKGANHDFTGDITVPANVNFVFAKADATTSGMQFAGGGYICVETTNATIGGTWTGTGVYMKGEPTTATLKLAGGTMQVTKEFIIVGNPSFEVVEYGENPALTISAKLNNNQSKKFNVSFPADIDPAEDETPIIKWGSSQNVNGTTFTSTTTPQHYNIALVNENDYKGIILNAQNGIFWQGEEGATFTDEGVWGESSIAESAEEGRFIFNANESLQTATVSAETPKIGVLNFIGNYKLSSKGEKTTLNLGKLILKTGAKLTVENLTIVADELRIQSVDQLILGANARVESGKTIAMAQGQTLVIDTSASLQLGLTPSFNGNSTIKISNAADLVPGTYCLINWTDTIPGISGYGMPKLDVEGYQGGLEVCLVPEADKLWLQVISAEQAARKPLVIMPWGDSITEGTNGRYTGANYRIQLCQKLSLAGYNVKTVGYWTSTPKTPAGTQATNKDWWSHSGRGSERLIAQSKNNDGTFYNSWANALDQVGNPDVVLMHCGINDMLNNPTKNLNALEAYTTFTNIVDKVMKARLETKFIITSPMCCEYGHSEQKALYDGDPDRTHRDVNKEFVKPLQEYIVDFFNGVQDGTIGGFDKTRLFYADMYNAIMPRWYANQPETHLNIVTDDNGDHCHPDWNGHNIMAKTWFDQIVAAFPQDDNGDYDCHLKAQEIPTTVDAADLGAEVNVPLEYRKGFKLVRKIELAGTEKTAPDLTIPEDAEKVGYFVEYVFPSATTNIHRWVWVDKPVDSATGMHIVGNHPAVINTAANETVDGSAVLRTENGGAFQIHRNLPSNDLDCTIVGRTTQLVFAYNGWTGSNANNDFGIGNFSQHFQGRSSDWTGMGATSTMNASNLQSKTIEIWVKVAGETTPTYDEVTDETPLDQVVPAEQAAILEKAGVKADKVAAWAKAKGGITGTTEIGGAINLEAFALDCSPNDIKTAKENFKVEITIDAEGIHVEIPSGTYNIDPILKGKTELTEKTWTPITDDNKSSMKFFKAFIEL